jgi:hypothetical protein
MNNQTCCAHLSGDSRTAICDAKFIVSFGIGWLVSIFVAEVAVPMALSKLNLEVQFGIGML